MGDDRRYVVIFGDSFEKRLFDYKNKISKKQLSKIDNLIALLEENPFHPALKSHKLKGKLQDCWAFSISYSDRMVFRFIEDNTLFLIDIGGHDDVY